MEPGLAAEVEDLGSGAEDGGDDAGFAGEAAGLAGGDVAAGVQAGGAEAAEELVEGHGDHDGGVHAAGLGDLVGGVAFDELAQAAAHQVGLVERGAVLGAAAVVADAAW